MYAFIIGKVVSARGSEVVLENNGIGYLLTVSLTTAAKCVVGNEQKLYTYLQVKEDLMALYGFASLEEKQFFENLITISGVGPKLAMTVLSGYDLNTLALAIATGDSAKLSKIKGLGKKTAERIILELRELYKSTDAGGEIPLLATDSATAASEIEDAVFALVSLGMTKSEATKAINKASEHVKGLENLISYALRNL